MASYAPPVYPGRLTLFRVRALSLFRSFDPEMGWGQLAAGGVEIQRVSGAHYNILDPPHVASLAAQLGSSLSRARATGWAG